MIAEGQERAMPPKVVAKGWEPSKKKGWTGLAKGQVIAYQTGAHRELSIAYVLYNDGNNHSVQVHSCRTIWTGMSVRHLREYRDTSEEGEVVTTEVSDNPVTCQVPYSALVKVVELYQDGRTMQGDASALSRGGWTFRIDEGERKRAVATAAALEHRLRR